jgi:hypothetical protein
MLNVQVREELYCNRPYRTCAVRSSMRSTTVARRSRQFRRQLDWEPLNGQKACRSSDSAKRCPGGRDGAHENTFEIFIEPGERFQRQSRRSSAAGLGDRVDFHRLAPAAGHCLGCSGPWFGPPRKRPGGQVGQRRLRDVREATGTAGSLARPGTAANSSGQVNTERTRLVTIGDQPLTWPIQAGGGIARGFDLMTSTGVVLPIPSATPSARRCPRGRNSPRYPTQGTRRWRLAGCMAR